MTRPRRETRELQLPDEEITARVEPPANVTQQIPAAVLVELLARCTDDRAAMDAAEDGGDTI